MNRRVEVEVEGKTRRYILHIPEQYRANRTLPLIIGFHGGGGSGKIFSKKWVKARDRGFLMAFPSADLNGARNWVVPSDSPDPEVEDRYQDIKFVLGMIDEIRKEFSVGKVFAAGFSSGGKMTWGLSFHATEHFDGFAIAGSLINKRAVATVPNNSKPVFFTSGTYDSHNYVIKTTFNQTVRKIISDRFMQNEIPERTIIPNTGRSNNSPSTFVREARYSRALIHQRVRGTHEWPTENEYNATLISFNFFSSLL